MPGFGDDQCQDFFIGVHNMFVKKTFNMSESVNFMGKCFAID